MAGPRASVLDVADAALEAAGAGSSRLLRTHATVTPEDAVRSLLELPGFFDAGRSCQRRFRAEVTRWAGALWDGDVRAVLRSPPAPTPSRVSPSTRGIDEHDC